jgi:hypothetical protein
MYFSYENMTGQTHWGRERERGRREGERERNDCKKVWPVKVRG